MTIMTSLAVLGALLPPAVADPCTALPAERVAAVFAAAGAPVTGDDSFGSGEVRESGFCNYTFADATGRDVGVQMNVVLRSDHIYTGCSHGHRGGERRDIPGLADEACVFDGGSRDVSVSFRSGDRAGGVVISWSSKGKVPSARVRRIIAEKLAREWVGLVTSGLSLEERGGSVDVRARILAYLDVQTDAASAAGSFSALKQHEGERVSAWAQRLAGDARLTAAFAGNGFTVREYLDFGLRVHDAWMAIEGRPTGNTPDPVLLETLRPMATGFRILFEGPQSSWPGMVR
ncbi:MAG: hypothetical protein ACREKM_07050 [Longimicrobiales bacterium]